MAAFHRPPRGLMRGLVRLPVWLYRARLGWLLGGRFLLLTHTGRTTGAPRRAVLEVVHHDPQSGTYFVAAAWAERSQWYRNIRRSPRVEVTVGRRHFAAVADALSAEEGEQVLRQYARRHPVATRALGRMFASAGVHRLALAIPVVALRRQT